jgi:hypothetical protein
MRHVSIPDGVQDRLGFLIWPDKPPKPTRGNLQVSKAIPVTGLGGL